MNRSGDGSACGLPGSQLRIGPFDSIHLVRTDLRGVSGLTRFDHLRRLYFNIVGVRKFSDRSTVSDRRKKYSTVDTI